MQAPPSRFGRYELLGTLGHGSFATVYRARDPLLQREVALKVLLPHLCAEPEDRARFLAEARALAGLRHPNVVTVFEAGEEAGTPYFAMELVEGQTLAELIAAQGAFSLDRALPLLRDLASALDAVHAAGLVHRDVKDSNVVLEPSARAVLMDFGIALSTRRTRLTQLGYGLGTPETAAPEQIRGETIGPAADIYALGILAYQVLSGRLPFTGNVAHVLYAQAHLPPPSLCEANPMLPPQLCAAVEAALAKDPALRPASAGAFVALLTSRAPPSRPPAVSKAAPLDHQEATASPSDWRGGISLTRLERGLAVRGEEAGSTSPFALHRGLVTFRIASPGRAAGTRTVDLLDGVGRAIHRLLVISARRLYLGTKAWVVPADGLYALRVRGEGPWTAEIEQPELGRATAGSVVRGTADGVAIIAIKTGTRRFAITHRVWSGGRFAVRLHNADGDPVTTLVVADGPYNGIAERKFLFDGNYVLVVEAEGDWSVVVS